ncbi:hypothetical protein RI543_002930 [Arxiozyma heterogenica]|uniref:Hyphally-regulated cell wall protein N-terminal domain-containing protein n=1 Tax=Arxiozyma heterogenica TaxID=278026 RepID=A0AAN7W1C9_9SACH|nr:hypothetical protein RI543_002930 [Kazachstania heterogenica]
MSSGESREITDNSDLLDKTSKKMSATLALISGSSYSFNGNIDVKGSLDIIGDSTNGLTSLQFGSTTTITNSGNINIENIKSAGSASDFVIAPASINNSGTFTVSQLNATATVPGTNFTLAPTGSFINTGTIDFDTADKGGTTNGFLYLGTMTNNGIINSGGLSALLADQRGYQRSKYDMKGIVFNNPIEGEGEVTGNIGAVIFLNTEVIGEQTFNVHNDMYIINPKVVPGSFKVVSFIGSEFVFLNIDFNKWYAEDLGTIPYYLQTNFAVDGHRYWFNSSCTNDYAEYAQGNIIVTPSDPLCQFYGTDIYMMDIIGSQCLWLSEPVTKTTIVTTIDSITEATTLSTLVTSTINQYFITVSEKIYQVAVPPLSTTYTTTTAGVSAPTTSTYTTTVVDSNGSSSPEVVVVVITPSPSTTYTTTTADVSAPTTTTVTECNGSSSPEVVVVIIPSPSGPTIYTTITGAVTAPTTSTYTTVITDSNGSSSTEVMVVIITQSPFSSFMTSPISVPSPLYGNSTISGEKIESTLSGTLVVLTTVVNGVTMTTTYCPEPSATSETSMTAIIGHSSIESVYSKNQQEETNSLSAASNATPVISVTSTTPGPAFTNGKNHPTSRNSRTSTTVIGNNESRRSETSMPSMVPQVSQYIPEKLSSSSTAVTIPHGGIPSLVSYEDKGGTMYVKWSVAHCISLLLFLRSIHITVYAWTNQDILNYREYIHDNPLCTWVITKEDIYKQNTSIFMVWLLYCYDDNTKPSARVVESGGGYKNVEVEHL